MTGNDGWNEIVTQPVVVLANRHATHKWLMRLYRDVILLLEFGMHRAQPGCSSAKTDAHWILDPSRRARISGIGSLTTAGIGGASGRKIPMPTFARNPRAMRT